MTPSKFIPILTSTLSLFGHIFCRVPKWDIKKLRHIQKQILKNAFVKIYKFVSKYILNDITSICFMPQRDAKTAKLEPVNNSGPIGSEKHKRRKQTDFWRARLRFNCSRPKQPKAIFSSEKLVDLSCSRVQGTEETGIPAPVVVRSTSKLITLADFTAQEIDWKALLRITSCISCT